MPYIYESLSQGEEVYQLFSLHWFAYILLFVWLLLAIPTAGITLILAVYEWLKLRSIEQGVTNKRVIRKEGIVSRRSEEMKVTSIETVEIEQGVIGRLFDYGDVKITGRGISDVVFKNIDDPMAVKRAIESVEPFQG